MVYSDLKLFDPYELVNSFEVCLKLKPLWLMKLLAEEQLQGMARAASGYHKVLAENRMLYNEVQDLKGEIMVGLGHQSPINGI